MISIAITLTKEMWELNKITGRNLSFLFPKINTATESTTSRDNSITINSPIIVISKPQIRTNSKTRTNIWPCKKIMDTFGIYQKGLPEYIIST